MPYMTGGKRDYAKERALYEKKHPARKGQRAALGRARYMLTKAKGAAAMEGKDVSHRKATSKGGSMGLSNLFLQDAGANRSYARNSDSSMKSEKSKRERRKSR
jgi:hypothetical protein